MIVHQILTARIFTATEPLVTCASVRTACVLTRRRKQNVKISLIVSLKASAQLVPLVPAPRSSAPCPGGLSRGIRWLTAGLIRIVSLPSWTVWATSVLARINSLSMILKREELVDQGGGTPRRFKMLLCSITLI